MRSASAVSEFGDLSEGIFGRSSKVCTERIHRLVGVSDYVSHWLCLTLSMYQESGWKLGSSLVGKDLIHVRVSYALDVDSLVFDISDKDALTVSPPGKVGFEFQPARRVENLSPSE